MTYKLVLLRHGQSAWNKTNQFTGWVDVPLTEQGEAEAKRGGELLKEKNVKPIKPRGEYLDPEAAAAGAAAVAAQGQK